MVVFSEKLEESSKVHSLTSVLTPLAASTIEHKDAADLRQPADIEDCAKGIVHCLTSTLLCTVASTIERKDTVNLRQPADIVVCAKANQGILKKASLPDIHAVLHCSKHP